MPNQTYFNDGQFSEDEIRHYVNDKMPKASKLKYGFEFELHIPREKVDELNIFVNPYHSDRRGTSTKLPDFFPSYRCPETGTITKWKAERDGSLWHKDGHVAMEIISPPMVGEAAFLNVWKMLERLQSLSAKVDFSCGLHIHVGMESITGDARADDVVAFLCELNKYVFNLQMGLYAQTGTRRDKWTNHGENYCRPLQDSNLVIRTAKEKSNKSKGTKTDWDKMEIRDASQKYSPLNCTKINEGGAATLEFRFMASTLNFEKVAMHLISINTLIRLAWKNRHTQRDAMSFDLNKGYHKASEATKGTKTLKALLNKVNKSKAGRLIRLDSPVLNAYWDKAQAKGLEMAAKFDRKHNQRGPRS